MYIFNIFNIRSQTITIAGTQEENHSSPDSTCITHLTHSIGAIIPPYFNIKTPIKTPKASDEKT